MVLDESPQGGCSTDLSKVLGQLERFFELDGVT
jgi:hypothetical protein